MPATASRIHEEFDFLLDRGYVLAAESYAGMAGTIAYRSPLLWLSLVDGGVIGDTTGNAAFPVRGP